MSTIRLVVTRPFPPGAPESLKAALGADIEVVLLDELSLIVTGPADASHAGQGLALVRGERRAARVAHPRAPAPSRTSSSS